MIGQPVRRVFAPGRVNLIGDHVDYMGGLVLPMAIDLGTTIEFTVEPRQLATLESDHEDLPVEIRLPVHDPTAQRPLWGRFPAAVFAELGVAEGLRGRVTSTLPIGGGLSSSASLQVAVALAGGFSGDPIDLARLCRRAERRATGVPCGIMDQLAVSAGFEGSALLIDCRDETFTRVDLPAGAAVHAVHCGVSRTLESSEYSRRRAECEAAEVIIGPLREAEVGDLDSINDDRLRRRARHVITEIARVSSAAEASRSGDAAAFGRAMNDSHASLRDDFEVSIPELDRLVDRLQNTPGVYGARLTGAGFGGCVVALVDSSVSPDSVGGWRLRPSAGAAMLPMPGDQ